jgi:hypothetical protein
MRVWKNGVADDGSIHCLGNGRLCAYGQGPNLIQVFGPPYSAPTLGGLALDSSSPIETHSEREAGTAIWTHRLLAGGQVVGEILDFVDADLPCFVRRMHLDMRFRFRLTLQHKATQVVENGDRLGREIGGWLCEIPSGTPFYSRYPFPAPACYQVAWRGAAHGTRDASAQTPGLSMTDAGGRDAETQTMALSITCEPGESWLTIAGGPSYPEAIQTAQAALATPPVELLERTRRWWQGFTRSRADLGDALSETVPQRQRLLQAADDVAVLIKAQQSAEGGVLAGHNYHLCYVRDQYGVGRGLLALGHVAEARAILEYYWRIWQRHGRIHNAQAAGVDGAFHVHENDEVEITGYLIRQAFDLADEGPRTKDERRRATDDAIRTTHHAPPGGDDFLTTLFPMLEWAWEAQKCHLVEGMLPFNGDETYVAGGILPRTALNDGSAEATLLLLDGGGRLVSWAERTGRWTAERIAAERGVLAAVRARYRASFWCDGRLLTNNPRRAEITPRPRFRHGVCERCHAERRGRYVEWTELSATGRYLCPSCLAMGSYVAAEPAAYALQSVSLTPLYFGTDLFDRGELAPLVEEIVQRYRATGTLPSRPDDARRIAVGYDYGFLLYALTELDHPFAGHLYERTLALADPTGAWVEYYADHQPHGTRCRPWESGINIEALLHYGR